jgi:response regulator RpfG family c-di-GMP phosphodiesterase
MAAYNSRMLRVLLVIDDYGELLFMQTLLKKLGFDVDGIQNQRSFDESILNLNPDLVLATAKGRKVNGVELAEGLRRTRGVPRVILLAPPAMAEKLSSAMIANVDAVLETPVGATRLLEKVAELGGVDKINLLEKYRRLKETLSPEREADLQILNREVTPATAAKPTAIKATAMASTLSSEERERRYQENIKSVEKPVTQFYDRERVNQYSRDIRATEDRDETARLEAERQEFVRQLFRKGKD